MTDQIPALDSNLKPGPVDVGREVKTLAKGALIASLGQVSNQVWSALAQIFMARSLSPEIFGLYALGWSVMRLLSPLAEFGMSKIANIYGVRYWKQDPARFRRTTGFVLLWGTGFSSLTALLLILASPLLAEWVFKEPRAASVFKAFAFVLVFQTLLLVCESLTLITQDARYGVWATDVLQPASNLVLMIVFVEAGMGLNGVMNATILSYALGTLLAIGFVIKLFPETRRAPRIADPPGGEILRAAGAIVLPGLFGVGLPWLNRLLLGAVRPVGDVGVYQAASQFSLLFALILMGVNAVFSPMIAKFHQTGQKHELDELYKVTTKWGFFLALPVSVVTLLVPGLVLEGIFGKAYAASALALQILTVGQLVNVGTGAIGSILIMTGNARKWSVCTFAGLVTTTAVTLGLAPALGPTGAAIANAASNLIIFSIGLYYVKRVLGLWPYDRRYWKGLAAALIGAGICALVFFITPAWPVLVRLILVSAGTLAGFGASLWAFGLDREDRQVLSAILAKLIPGRLRKPGEL